MSPSEGRPPYDLYIAGLGIVSVRQVTREAESAMRRSTEIFYASDAIGIDGYRRAVPEGDRGLRLDAARG